MAWRRRLLAATLFIVIMSTLAAGAGAATLTYSFFGHITDSAGLPVPTGTPLSLVISYPADTPPNPGGPVPAEYVHEGGTAALGSATATTDIPHPTFIQNRFLDDAFRTGLGFFADAQEVIAGYLMTFIFVDLFDPDGEALSSDALPLALDLADFEQREFLVILEPLAFEPERRLTGIVDRIEISISQIAEPSSAATVFGIGLAFVVAFATAAARVPRRGAAPSQ